jgi:isoleucyl-tRNA synthetase
VVRLLQDLRKTSGLEVSDRIHLNLVGLEAIADYFDYIAREVLAVEIVAGAGDGEGTTLELDADGAPPTVTVWLRKAEGSG